MVRIKMQSIRRGVLLLQQPRGIWARGIVQGSGCKRGRRAPRAPLIGAPAALMDGRAIRFLVKVT